MPLEIACFNTSSALAAIQAGGGGGGADRIELCAGPVEVGGITPDLDMLVRVREELRRKQNHQDSEAGDKNEKNRIPIFIMIRPRGGDFFYSDHEFEAMKRDVLLFKDAAGEGGCDGFVFGILERCDAGEDCGGGDDGNGDGRKAKVIIDVSRTSQLVSLASPLPCTFHRAFDELGAPPSSINDIFNALEDVIRSGCTTLLTSGGHSKAIQGADILAKLVDRARGRIVVMPGGGVRASNLQELMDRTGAEWYHSSALVAGEEEVDEGGGLVASREEVRALRGILEGGVVGR